jgi:hypothetical protein
MSTFEWRVSRYPSTISVSISPQFVASLVLIAAGT